MTWSNHQLSRTVEEIITAVMQLSEKKIGAIIVIERQIALGEFIETGVRLDSHVKSALIETIFQPPAPLHDLAIVIRGDRIVAARVQLPLAELGSVTDELGSRHRAAVGITKGSDALAIVVSEETGSISVAEEGRLQRNITAQQLRKALTTAIVDAGPLTARFWRGSKA